MNIKLKKRYRKYTIFLLFLIGLSGCNNIDCTLENVVSSTYDFYNSETKSPLNLTDTLTIRTCGSDSILYNKGYDIKSVKIPMSYSKAVDTLLFIRSASKAQATDTIFVSHTNEPFFESIDCGTSVFHTIKSIFWKTGSSAKEIPQIDSIAVLYPKVNYEQKTHFRIYFHNT